MNKLLFRSWTATILTVFIAGTIPVFGQKQTSALQTEIFDDDFVHKSHLELRSFLAKYKPVLLTKERHVNEHDVKQIDYIITYTLGQDKFIFYQTPSKALTTYFSLASGQLVLANSIRVGMTKQAFEKAFKHKAIGNTATVAELEQFELYTFSFAKNTLSRIIYQCRID